MSAEDYKEFPTKESALDWLDNYLSLDERNNLIKALEQETMRDATPEERESVDKYVKSISKPTGVNFWDLEREPSGDLISRQAVEEMIKAEMPERGMWEIEGDKEKETVCEVCVDLIQKLSDLPSVNSQPICEEREKGECPYYAG